MFKKLLGTYAPPMAEVMAETPWETKSVLDLGCGSGSWYGCFSLILSIAQIIPG